MLLFGSAAGLGSRWVRLCCWDGASCAAAAHGGFPAGTAGQMLPNPLLLAAQCVCLTQGCFSPSLLAHLSSPLVEGRVSTLFKIFIHWRSAACLNDGK